MATLRVDRLTHVFLVLLAVTASFFSPVRAQSGGRLVLLPLDLSRFPKVSFMMEAYEPTGQFIPDLTEQDMLIIEDGASRPVEHFTRLQSGVHLVVAFNAGPSLGYSYAGSTALEQVRRSLLDWSSRQAGSTLDEFSLVSNSGSQVTKLSDPGQWSAVLRNFAPELLKVQPSLTSLAQAFDLVTDAGRRSTSKRAVLWITPPLADSNLPALPNLADRASQLDARIFVWLVVPAGSGQTKSQAAMADLAQKTGGAFHVFSGGQSNPNLESWLQPLRFIYQVEYTSAARASATHRLQVLMRRDEANPASAEQRFTLNLQPPNPVFLSPPTTIQRSWVAGIEKNEFILKPDRVDLPLLVEFPDSFVRALSSTRLYVDGKLVSESTNPNPTGITWLLEDFKTSRQHTIRVEVEDALGFKRASIEIPVEIRVDSSALQSGLDTAFFSSNSLSLPLAGGLLVLVIGGATAVWITHRRKARSGSARVIHTWEQPRLSTPSSLNRRTSLAQDTPARLVRLTEDGQALPANSIPLPHQNLSLGTDPKKATLVVESNSMDGIHARIQALGEQDYIIQDAGSLAGTWVNFEPVAAGGTRLEHGDLVHMGRESYRFELKDPRQVLFLHVQRIEKDAKS